MRDRGRAAPAPVTPTAPQHASIEDPATPALAASIRTELGGLFHLVHVGQLLGLYGDFTTPARPGIALPVWDFVTLLGGRLLRRRPPDPVWTLLAELAGREPADPPGRGFRPPRAWRVPADWVSPFPARGSWSVGEAEDRVQLLHPAGFIAVDAPGAQLARELRRYALHEPLGRSRLPSLAALSARERWLEHLTAYVRARLAAALAVRTRRAARLALMRPALVYVTDTRVDVVSALADLPIEVRLAGLDRDPGYVPAAGRALLFHFE